MSIDRIVNLRATPLRQFKKGDTLYIRKLENDFTSFFLCEFLRIEKGMVIAKVKEVENNWQRHMVDTEIKARSKNCYLWGRLKNDRMQRDYCHWFTSLDTPAGY